MNSDNLDTGPTVNVNKLMQELLDMGGVLELVVRKDATFALNLYHPGDQTEQHSVELDKA